MTPVRYVSTLVLVALAYCSWIVALAGLSALQHDCLGDDSGNEIPTLPLMNGQAGGLPEACSTTYRFPWFIMSFEFVTLCLVLGTTVTGMLDRLMSGLIGMLAVATVLFINLTDAWLVAFNLPMFDGGAPGNRVRVFFSGLIITCVFNCALFFAIGSETHHENDNHHVADKGTLQQIA